MTVKTITKGITFEQAMKLFTKFVSRSKTRPVLQYVYYNSQSGYLVATDSHQLLRISSDYITDFSTDKESFLYDPKKSIYITEQYNYPNTDRIIPDTSWSNSTVEINNNIKELHNTVKEVKKHVAKNKVIILEFTHSDLTISGNKYIEKEDSNGIPVETIEHYSKTLDNIHVSGEEITLHCNAAYFENILTATKKLSKLSNDQVTINMVSHLRPVHITLDNVFDAILLPVRTY